MAEEVIIRIQLEKQENEKQVTDLTKKLLDLKKANEELNKEQKALKKAGQENSALYVENAKQIALNNQKIQEATASRKNLIQTLVAEDSSIKALNARNAELRKERNLLNTATVEGREAIAAINREIDKNNKTIIENSSALEKQRFNVGNYKSALDGLVPGLGAFVDSVQNGTKAALAFIATPFGAVIGAIGLALSSLIAYFKGSEEGQNKWNKVIAVGSAILEQLMNVVEDVGGALVDMFTNPKQAAIDFGNFLKDQILNRLIGIYEFIPQIGKAFDQLFKGNFAEAGKIAGDAVGKVVLGIENATDKIGDFINQTGALIEQGIKNGERLAALNAQIDKDERTLIESRAKTALEVAKLREAAIEQEGEARKATLLEAIALEESLTEKEVALSKIRLDLAKAEMEANGDDKEAKKQLAEATAAVFAAETTAFQNTIKFRKEIASLDEQAAAARKKATEDALAEDRRLKDEQKAAEQQQFENNLAVLENQYLQESLLLKEKFLNDQLTKEQYEAEVTTLEISALEQRRGFYAMNAAETLTIDTQLTDKRIANKERELKAEQKSQAEKDKLRRAEVSGINASLDAAVGLAREAFGETKAIAVAETVMNTVRGIVRAIADYPFPYSLIVSAIVGALGTAQTARIIGLQFARGGVLNGPSHAQGGIPFTVRGTPGFEAEGGEAIINKKSTAMFRPILSQINQAGGGVAFERGGVTRFQTGSVIASTQTSQAARFAETRMDANRIIAALDRVQTVLVLEEFETKQGSVHDGRNTATII